MIFKIKSVVTLDVPDELMEEFDISSQELIDKYAVSTQMEIVDENGNDFMEFGTQEIMDEIKEFTSKIVIAED